MTASTGRLLVAPTDQGCAIRVEGQGTTTLSPAAGSLASAMLERDAHAVVVFDLTACDYLDSTFIGLLMDLHRLAGSKPGRVVVAAPEATRRKLLGPSMVDRVIESMPAPPPLKVQFMPVEAQQIGRRELLRHIAQCHATLAEVEGPMQPLFRQIAEQVMHELQATGDSGV